MNISSSSFKPDYAEQEVHYENEWDAENMWWFNRISHSHGIYNIRFLLCSSQMQIRVKAWFYVFN